MMQYTDERISLGAVVDGLRDNAFALVFLSASAVGIAGLSAISMGEWWGGFWQNFSTEVFGAVFQFVIFGIILAIRDKARDVQLQRDIAEETRQQVRQFLVEQQKLLEEQEWRQLVDQLASHVPGNAAEAVRLLKSREGWFKEEDIVTAIRARGDLARADLRDIDLTGADLLGARLKQVDLQGAKLDGAFLTWAEMGEASLRNASLIGADLKEADLREANLRDAQLTDAVLSNARLDQAILYRANMRGALLYGVSLKGAFMHETDLTGARQLTLEQLRSAVDLTAATLPDGTTLPQRDTSMDPNAEEQPWRAAFAAWADNAPMMGEFIRHR